MKCNYNNHADATHYVNVIFSGDERWEFDTEYAEDYVCQEHIHDHIRSHTNTPGITIHEITVKELP